MRISDWSSDVCSSDLGALYVFNNSRDRLVLSSEWGRDDGTKLPDTINPNACWAVKRGKPHTNRADRSKLCCEHQHGDRKSVVEGKRVSVRLDRVGRRLITKKKNTTHPDTYK